MAALPQSAIDLANSLAQDDIPVKLRCAICNRLVVNAFRLPCCDQNICESCQASLPDSCPVCAHSPISAEDCKPNKNLRLTVKAFIKSEEKKREKERTASSTVIDPPTQSAPSTPLSPVTESVERGTEVHEDGLKVGQSDHSAQFTTEANLVVAGSKPGVDATDVKDISIPNTDNSAPLSEKEGYKLVSGAQVENETTLQSDENSAVSKAKEENNAEGQASSAGWIANSGQDAGQMYASYGFNGNQNAYPGMEWNQVNGFNPMMQMQMQNNISNGEWGGFPNMIGMQGMNPMDMSQGMYGGYRMQGMNMNMDYNSGYGWNNGQQMSSDFGPGNYYTGGGGYNQSHPGQFSQMQQQNSFQNQNRFHGQGAFANRAPGRGGMQQGNAAQGIKHGQNTPNPGPQREGSDIPETDTTPNGESAFTHQLPSSLQSRQSSKEVHSRRGSAVPQAKDDTKISPSQSLGPEESATRHEEVNQVQDIDVNADIARTDKLQPEVEPNGNAAPIDQESNSAVIFQSNDLAMQNNVDGQYGSGFDLNTGFNQDHEAPYPMKDYLYQPGAGNEFSGRGRGRGGFGRGGFRGRGGFGQYQTEIQVVSPAQSVGVGVEGAPTGPRAMREGLPNTGFRGRGAFHTQARGGHQSTERVTSITSERQEPERQRSRSRSRSRSKSKSHSPSRRHRRRRDRSRSPSTDKDSYGRERRHRRRRSSRRKYEDDDEQSIYEEDDREVRDKENSRSLSVESPRSKHKSISSRREKEKYRSSRSHRDSSRERRRNKHRSRSPNNHREDDDVEDKYDIDGDEKAASESAKKRNRSEKYRERDRTRDRPRDKERKSSRRDRSVSREEDDHHRSSRHSRREKVRDADRDRDKGRDRDRERSKERSSRHPSKPAPEEPEEELKIHGRSKDRLRAPPSQPAAMQPPSGPRALLAKLSAGKPLLGSATKRTSQPPTPTLATAPSPSPVDPHTLEREARNRERMLKEEQRRKLLRGGAGGGAERKRSYTEATAGEEQSFMPPTEPSAHRERRKKGRRTNYKYEDEENDEARARRVEREREDQRWS